MTSTDAALALLNKLPTREAIDVLRRYAMTEFAGLNCGCSILDALDEAENEIFSPGLAPKVSSDFTYFEYQRVGTGVLA